VGLSHPAGEPRGCEACAAARQPAGEACDEGEDAEQHFEARGEFEATREERTGRDANGGGHFQRTIAATHITCACACTSGGAEISCSFGADHCSLHGDSHVGESREHS